MPGGASLSITIALKDYDRFVAAITGYAEAEKGLDGEPLPAAERVDRVLWHSRIMYGKDGL